MSKLNAFLKGVKMQFFNILNIGPLVAIAWINLSSHMDPPMVHVCLHVQCCVCIFYSYRNMRAYSFETKWPPASLLTNQRAESKIVRYVLIWSFNMQKMKALALIVKEIFKRSAWRDFSSLKETFRVCVRGKVSLRKIAHLISNEVSWDFVRFHKRLFPT